MPIRIWAKTRGSLKGGVTVFSEEWLPPKTVSKFKTGTLRSWTPPCGSIQIEPLSTEEIQFYREGSPPATIRELHPLKSKASVLNFTMWVGNEMRGWMQLSHAVYNSSDVAHLYFVWPQNRLDPSGQISCLCNICPFQLAKPVKWKTYFTSLQAFLHI